MITNIGLNFSELQKYYIFCYHAKKYFLVKVLPDLSEIYPPPTPPFAREGRVLYSANDRI
jgi:hypothetical protein